MGTYAPQQLLALRQYMKGKTGLADNALGIVGDTSHVGGYHHGWSMRRLSNGNTADYSWNESARDWGHTSDAASAFDIGMFPRLRELSLWLVRECEAGAPDTLDIREVIYSPDGIAVRRWDRLRRRSSGDDSHLTHTHVSFFRDAEDRDKVGVFQRFFEGGSMELFREEGIEYIDTLMRGFVAGLTVTDAVKPGNLGAGRPIKPNEWLLQIMADTAELKATVSRPDPVALAQALVAQPGFTDAIAESVVRKLIERLQGGVTGADQP